MLGRTLGAACAVAMAVACADSSNASSFEVGDAPAFEGQNGQDGGGGLPPPEREVESDYEAPVATGKLVWIANPKSGRVALVEASTLLVRTVEAGNGPTYLAAVPGQDDDTTVVLNVLSEDATVLRANAQAIKSTTLKTAKQVNALAFSSDGRYAIAWADARKVKNAPKTQGFQDLTILDLVANTSTTLAVGYRPVLVGFVAGETRAYAVTQDGVAIVDVAAARVTKNIAISDTPTEDPGTRDVFVTKDGKSAYVRRDNSAALTIVSLDDDKRTSLTLSGPVTDMDLADTGERAVAVSRETAQVAIIPIAAPETFTSVTLTGETVGSVAIAPGGGKGLLYTNAVAAERFTIVDFAAAASYRTVRLYSPVLGIFSAPDAQHAVVVHDKTAGPEGSPGAFSLVPIGQTLPAKIVATEAPVYAVATVNDRAVVAERDDNGHKYGAYLARMPQLMVDRYPLASPPIAVGVVEGAKRAYVAQQHPEGRLTFIDLESGVARTLTGFELSSRVVDGSKP